MAGIPQPAFYLFACSVERPAGFPKGSCIKPENRDLIQSMAQVLMSNGIMGTVQLVPTNCLNRCNLGPVMMVEPSHTLYVGLTKEKFERIVAEHIIGGNIVEEYVVPEAMWGDAISPADMKKMAGM